MDYGVGEVYSGVFTVRSFAVYRTTRNPYPLFRASCRTRTRSGTSCTLRACANTIASGGCRSTRSTARRSTGTTQTSSTYVFVALVPSLICVLIHWMGRLVARGQDAVLLRCSSSRSSRASSLRTGRRSQLFDGRIWTLQGRWRYVCDFP